MKTRRKRNFGQGGCKQGTAHTSKYKYNRAPTYPNPTRTSVSKSSPPAVSPTSEGASRSLGNQSTVSVLDAPMREAVMESFNTRFLAILACGSSEAIGRGERTTLRFLAQLPTNLLAPHADLGAKHELHRITEVLYESCWRLARTNLEHDVSVTSFFQRFWRLDGFPHIY